MDTMFERFKRLSLGELPQEGIGGLLGLQVTAVEPGAATVTMVVQERFANPMGTLHGGILCDLSDAAMGIAYASQLQEGESFTTLELKCNFLKPVWRGTLTASARVVKAGRTVGMAECDVTDEGGSLVARVSSTCMTLRGSMSEGR
jgi:uncharacterized protein (TIGR00369 family)